MNRTIVILKKELKRFFTDPKLVLQVILFPGLLIYIMYSLLGEFMMNETLSGSEENPIVIVENMPESMAVAFDTFNFDVREVSQIDKDLVDVEEGVFDAVIQFPENFDELISQQQEVAKVDIYYNGKSNRATGVYYATKEYLEIVEESIFNVIDVNSDLTKNYNFLTEEDASAQVLSMILPMLTIMFIFSSALSIAPESIAGEKERGTMATLLVTPMKRSSLALGKIISIAIITALATLSTITGVILSLPKLIGGELSLSAYGVQDVGLLLLAVLSILPVIITLLLVISTFSKNAKEATTAATPFMIMAVLGGLSSTIGGGTENIMMGLIPLYNVSAIISDILSQSLNPLFLATAVFANLVYGILMGLILNKMLNSERYTIG